jgi:outer membrane protein OmpA-like peptidoglycan-associated protein
MTVSLTRRTILGAGAALLLPARVFAQTDEEATRILRELAPLATPPDNGGTPEKPETPPDGREVDAEGSEGATEKIRVDNGRAIDLQIYFGFNSDRIERRSFRTVDALAAAMMNDSLAGQRFLIAGHTDAVGRDAYNLELSRRRARAVRRYLIEKHPIDARRLYIVGYGPTRLADPDNPRAAINRRVEIAVLLP